MDNILYCVHISMFAVTLLLRLSAVEVLSSLIVILQNIRA